MLLSTQRFSNQNSFDEGYHHDNLGLARVSYDNIFHDSRTQ